MQVVLDEISPEGVFNMKRVSILFITLLLICGQCFGKSFQKPEALMPGDTIAIIAPAYPLNSERVPRIAKRLKDMGFKVKYGPNIYERYGYLAGSDEERAKYLMAAYKDPEVKGIFPGTGGFGTTRMLDLLDYDYIRKHPKVFIGFSDITGLHLAINKKCSQITFHSPNPLWGLGSESGLHPFSEKYFWRAIKADKYFSDKGEKLPGGWTYEIPDDASKIVTIVSGVAEGRLIGGNLSLVAALMGTPYEIETKGKILFLEDVNEEPYRIDRYLSQLELGGKFEDVSGVVLGRWRKCVAEDPEESLTLEQVFNDYFSLRDYPVIVNFPIGHVSINATLPIGAMAELDADNRTLKVLEDPVMIPISTEN